MNDVPDDRARVRRHDRAIYDRQWMVAFLRRAEYGVLAVCDGEQPFTVARNFVYDEARHAVYFHGARKGRTFELARSRRRATLNVSRMGRLLPASQALNMSVEYAGVVLFGTLTLVDDPDEARQALTRLVEKYFPHLRAGRDYTPVRDADLRVTAVLRLDVETWSGKQKQAPPDYPGAFWFHQVCPPDDASRP